MDEEGAFEVVVVVVVYYFEIVVVVDVCSNVYRRCDPSPSSVTLTIVKLPFCGWATTSLLL